MILVPVSPLTNLPLYPPCPFVEVESKTRKLPPPFFIDAPQARAIQQIPELDKILADIATGVCYKALP